MWVRFYLPQILSAVKNFAMHCMEARRQIRTVKLLADSAKEVILKFSNGRHRAPRMLVRAVLAAARQEIHRLKRNDAN